MTIKAISTADAKSDQIGSYARVGVQIGGIQYCRWMGFALVQPGSVASVLDVIIPSEQRGLPDTVGLMLPANSLIQSIGIHSQGNLTLGAATGKLKLAPALNTATTGLMAESPSAVGGILTMPTQPSITRSVPAATIGASDTVFRLFATDGGVGAAATASTVSATRETRVLVCIDFINYAPFPRGNEIPPATPRV